MALRLVLLLVLVAVVCQAQEEGGNPRQRLRALFNRRRAESAGKPGNDNVGEGAEGRSPFRLRRIRPRRPLVAEKKEDNEEEEEGQIIGVSSSVSTSSSSEVRRRPLIRTPVREEENEVSQDVVESKESGEELTSDEVLDVKGKLTAREKARLRFKKLRSGNRDEKDELLDRLLNNVNIQQTSGGRRRFRPSVDRSKLRKKTESAFNPARPASKFRLRLRRPEATTEAQTTVVTEEPVTAISVSAVTSRSETEARETFAPEAREQGEEQRTTVAGRTGSPSTGVPTTERSFLALRTTQQEERRTTLQEVVTEAATVRRTTEAATTKRPKKFDFSRSRLRPKLRTSPTTTTTTTEAPATTTSQPLRTTVLEERRIVPTTFAPTPQPFQIRVEESVFDSFPRINQGGSSSADVLKKLQLIASDKKPSAPQRRPQPITLRPAFTFPKPKEVPVIIEEELELENEIIDTNPFQFVPKEVRPAFVGVTTSVKIPKKLESVVLKEVAREPIVFEVEETVRSIEQPKRPQVEITRPASPVRRPTSSERRPASTGRRVNNLAQIPVRRVNQSQRRPQPQQSLLQPEQLPAFNQIQPEPIKPIVFTPRNFDLPKFFTEPFTFQATFNRAPGPGSYAYSVGL